MGCLCKPQPTNVAANNNKNNNTERKPLEENKRRGTFLCCRQFTASLRRRPDEEFREEAYESDLKQSSPAKNAISCQKNVETTSSLLAYILQAISSVQSPQTTSDARELILGRVQTRYACACTQTVWQSTQLIPTEIKDPQRRQLGRQIRKRLQHNSNLGTSVRRSER